MFNYRQLKMWSIHLYGFGSLLIFFHIIHQVDAVDEFPCFKDPLNAGSLSNVAYDATKDKLYVGAVDSVYRLSPDLKTLNSRQTGPVCSAGAAEPCKNCSNGGNVCPQNDLPVASVNKLLLVNSADNALIACSNILNGSCRSFGLDDLSETSYRNVSVLPSNSALSAVGFIGKGQNVDAVMYVGTSYSPDNASSYDVPIISVRNPVSFELIASVIDLNPNVRQSFTVEFVASFQRERFVYFFIRRRSGTSVASFLLRICKDQPKKTLVELPLSCHRGTSFPYLRDAILVSNSVNGMTADAIYAVFTRDRNAENSALCIYPMSEVDKKYQTAIQDCFNGNGVKGPNYATSDTRACIQMNLPIGLDHCQDIESNSPIEANETLDAYRAFPLEVHLATSIAALKVNGFLVLYIGSSNGSVLKATVSNPQNDQLVSDWVTTVPVQVLHQPIKSVIVGAADNLYLLTDKHLCKALSYDCSKAHSCEECVKDPHCGWCMRNRSCVHKDECPSVGKMNVWLNQPNQCPVVLKTEPSVFSVNLFKQTSMEVNVKHIPEFVPNASCVLKNQPVYISDQVSASFNNGSGGGGGGGGGGGDQWHVACSPLSPQPQLAGGLTSLNLTLVVSLGGLQWFKAPVTIFDCSQMKSCTGCAELAFPCVWCSKNHICRHQSQLNDCAVAEIDIDTVNQSAKCPRIQLANGTGSLLVTGSGQQANFHFAAFNIMPFHQNGSLKCLFRSENGSVVYADAVLQTQNNEDVRLSRRSVRCASAKLNYLGNVASEFFSLDLVWGSRSEFVIDNPSSLKVEVFKCNFKAKNCGRCLLLDEAYGCVWCMDSCTHPSDCAYAAFLERYAMCPNPKITSFSPRGGPVGGQTVLTINGVNLGKSASNLTVRVANQPCTVLNDGYLPSERVTCRTGKVETSCNVTILLSVKSVINSTESEEVYIYKDPNITSFSPRKGPASGGTLITAVGTDFDLGSLVEVSVAEFPAKLQWRNRTHLVFIVPPHVPPSTYSTSVKISVDHNQIPFKSNGYSYVDDPMVTSINPTVSLLSGGNVLEFRGTNLQYVSNPQFVLYIRRENFTTNCSSPSQSFMHCSAPDLRDFEFGLDEKLEFDFGFIMDDVKPLLRIQSTNPNIGQLSYVRDPYILKFKSPVSYSANKPLKIYGENLTTFQVFTDFNIFVNDLKCSSPVFTPTAMSCVPPNEPKNLNSKGDATVVVSIGNLRVEVGHLSYYDDELPLALIIGIACGVAIPLLIGAIVLIVFLRRRGRRRRSTSLVFGRMEGSRKDRANNSYSRTEMEPLRENPHVREDRGHEDSHNDDEHFIQNLLRKIENPRRRNAAREILVSRDRLDMGSIIGRGCFSCVYLATLKDASLRSSVQVAAKTIEGPVFDEKLLETILRESVVMSNFNHSRLVSLIGLCLSSRTNPIVILPYMFNGNLRTYIKDKSKNFTARQLLLMSQQVAEGMSYLSSCDLVHRNLAARSCLLDEKLEVKVSDFVLCHELFEHGLQYGSPDDWNKLPIKWMAPETLEGFVFTPYSDVWSFGVLVWELMTRGITPYSDIPLSEMKVFLNSGQRLKKPKYCPETVYRIMADCWQKVAERRPTFPDLVNRLEVLLNPPRKRQPASLAADEEPLYVNTTEPLSQSYLRPSVPSPSPSA